MNKRNKYTQNLKSEFKNKLKNLIPNASHIEISTARTAQGRYQTSINLGSSHSHLFASKDAPSLFQSMNLAYKALRKQWMRKKGTIPRSSLAFA